MAGMVVVAACIALVRLNAWNRQLQRNVLDLSDVIIDLRSQLLACEGHFTHLGWEVVAHEGANGDVLGRALKRVAQGEPWDQNPRLAPSVAKIAAQALAWNGGKSIPPLNQQPSDLKGSDPC